MPISRSELARQLRGHVELLSGGGLREIALSREARDTGRRPVSAPAAPTATNRRQELPKQSPSAPRGQDARGTHGRDGRVTFKPVIADSVALEELKQFDSDTARKLEPVAEEVRVCAACALCESRTQTVFGTGDPRSPLMVIGEAPGGDEDLKGRPFVGRAGKLLTDIIEKGMKYRREHVYISNVLKCRPPGNRNPAPEEIEACRGYLERQIEIINPKVILAVGLFPAQWLTGVKASLGRLRAKVHEVNGRKVVCTYHPAYVLRNYTVETRKKVHEDVKLVLEILGDPPLLK